MDAPPIQQVLIVDDDPVFRRIVVDALSAQGIVAREEEDAARAVGRARETSLLVVDRFLGGDDGLSDGVAVCRAIRAVAPEAILILATGRPMGLALARDLGRTFDDFFIKQHDVDELVGRVVARLSGHARMAVSRRREAILRQLVALPRQLPPYPAGLETRLGPVLLQLPGVLGVELQVQRPARASGPSANGAGAAPGEETFRAGEHCGGSVRAREGGESLGERKVSPGTYGSPESRVVHIALAGPPPARLRVRIANSLGDDVEALLGEVLEAIWSAAALHQVLAERVLRLEQALQRSSRRLEKVSSQNERLREMRDAFLTLMSHDLRSPSAVIVGHCQLIEEGLLGADDWGKALETIRRESVRLTTMIEETLDRYRKVGLEGSTAAGNLVDILTETLSSFQALATRRGQRIELKAPAPIPVETDLAAVQEAFANLLENALRNGPPGTLVEVTAATTPLEIPGAPTFSSAQVLVELKDRGRVEHREEVGLGFQACARLLESCGGSLQGAPLAGGGYATRLFLPSPAASRQAPRVLVVSGEPELAASLQEALLRHFDVSVLPFGPGNLERIVPLQPGVIVLDGATTDEALALALKAHPEVGSVPLVCVRPRGFSPHCFAVVPEPLEPGALRAQVSRAARLIADQALTEGLRDPLTGLFTGETVAHRLPGLLLRGELPVVLVSLPGLRSINRTRGWATGDMALVWLAGVLLEHCREGDLVARVSPQEFLLVLPGRTLVDATQVASELTDYVSRIRPRLGTARVAVSIATGIYDAASMSPPPDLEALLRAARRRGAS